MDQLIRLQELGEDRVEALLHWTKLPDGSEKSVFAIKRYYCQWQWGHPTLATKYVMEHHDGFFARLSCPSYKYDDLGVIH